MPVPADNQNFLDDLFADTADSNNPELFDYFAEETLQLHLTAKCCFCCEDQEELDLFSMLDNEEMANLESLPSDEELPLDDLFGDDLFSDGDNSKTTRLEFISRQIARYEGRRQNFFPTRFLASDFLNCATRWAFSPCPPIPIP